MAKDDSLIGSFASRFAAKEKERKAKQAEIQRRAGKATRAAVSDVKDLGRGAAKLPVTAYEYLRKSTPTGVVRDVGRFAVGIGEDIAADPAGFVAEELAAPLVAARDFAVTREKAAEARAAGDTETADKLEQFAALAVVGGVPIVGKGAKKAVRKGVKEATEKGAKAAGKKAVSESRTLKGAPSEYMVSTRRPSAPNYEKYGNPDEELLLQSGEAMRLTPEGFAKNMQQLTEAPFLADLAGADPDAIYDAAVRRGADNLKFIVQDLMPPEKAAESMEWYPTAHLLGKEYAARIDKPDAAGWGGLAVTSPQTPWPVNVARIDRITQMLPDRFAVDPEGLKAWMAKREAMRPEQRGAVYSQGMPYMQRVLETPYDQLETDMDRYARIVMADASRFPSRVQNISPKGEFYGDFGPMTWGTSREIGSAMRILEDPSMENIRGELTGGGKVPSFFNDIATPYTGLPTATMDTHSTGAFSLFPGGGNDPIVYRGMGLGAPKGLPPAAYSSAATGSKGLYGAMVDAHALAAKELGLDRVNAVQSMTWEGVRDLWGDSAKTPALKKAIDEIQRTSRTPEEMRFRVAELLGRPVKRVYQVKK